MQSHLKESMQTFVDCDVGIHGPLYYCPAGKVKISAGLFVGCFQPNTFVSKE